MNTDKLIAAYVKIRDAKNEVKREYDDKIAALQEQLDTIEAALLGLVEQTGVDSMKTKSGTAYRSVKTRYWAPDWASFKDFIEEHGSLDLLEQRIHQGNFKTFLEENPDVKPPVNVDSRYTIVVRRGNK